MTTSDDPTTRLANTVRGVLDDTSYPDTEARVTAIVNQARAAGLLRDPGPSHTEWGVLVHNSNTDGAFWTIHRDDAETWVEDGDRLITRTRTTHPDTITDWTYAEDWPATWTIEPD